MVFFFFFSPRTILCNLHLYSSFLNPCDLALLSAVSNVGSCRKAAFSIKITDVQVPSNRKIFVISGCTSISEALLYLQEFSLGKVMSF